MRLWLKVLIYYHLSMINNCCHSWVPAAGFFSVRPQKHLRKNLEEEETVEGVLHTADGVWAFPLKGAMGAYSKHIVCPSAALCGRTLVLKAFNVLLNPKQKYQIQDLTVQQ